mmetsp:Transcript_47839/g.54186  ORF Transcript_47839/g.54186 Transcript_47839/m.54186 type:complete len:963 (-) Transcript_47839:112-3000(-)
MMMMQFHIVAFTLITATVLSPAAGATAGPKYGGVFLADQRLDGIYLLKDLDGNGDAEADDEATLYFDNNNSGLTAVPSGLGNPFKIHTGQSGYVYVGCGDTDAVFRLEDINHNGNAQDPGEASVWFSAAENDAGLTLPTPNGIWETNDGATVVVYIVNAGTGSQPEDYVLRTQDLDGDGNANGPGEAIIWCNLGVLVSELLNRPPNISSAFEIVFIGDVAYIIDSAGGNEVILRAEDTNNNGLIDAGELTIVLKLSDAAPLGITDFFSALTTMGPDFVISTFFDSPPGVWFLNDQEGSGMIDTPEDVKQTWTGSNVPPGKEVNANFGMAAAQLGTNIYTASNDAEGGVFRLVDSMGEGNYNALGEVILFRSMSADGLSPTNRPRNVEVLPEFFQAKGYYGVSNVDKQNDLPYDLQQVALLLDTFSLRPPDVSYELILDIYEGTRVLTPLSFADFADGTDPVNPVKSFQNIFPGAVAYFGTENFLDLYIRGAIMGTGRFAESSDSVRGAAILSGLYSLLTYFVTFELRFSEIKTQESNFGCREGAPHNFDEAMAFFYGPRGQSSLLAYFEQLQQKIGMGKNSVTGENYFTFDPNKVIIDNFIDGIEKIAPNRPPLGSNECLPPFPALYPTDNVFRIEVVRFRTFLVACADQARSILSNNVHERDYAIEFLNGLYLSVGPAVLMFAPDADAIIKLQMDLLSTIPYANIMPGATLVDTFDRLLDQVDNPTAAPTPDPTSAPTTAPTDAPTEELPTMDIPTTATTLGFTDLVAALQAAHLAVLLADPPNPGPLTVFAPSNAAFAKLGDDLLICLSQPEYVLVLQDILNYHYTYGKVLAGDLSNGQVITMANGKDITINIDDSLVYINECPDFPTGCPFVQITDVMATNGVIHAINNVLIPPDVDMVGFLDMCLATDPPEPTPAPQPEPTPAPTPELTPEPTPKPTRSSKSSKKTRRSGSTSKSKRY